jgi:hypothetical protein
LLPTGNEPVRTVLGGFFPRTNGPELFSATGDVAAMHPHPKPPNFNTFSASSETPVAASKICGQL